ncbi:MAG: glycoside hydrolase family 3 C-terminal domain-containing protein [Treponema sp.]|jgi:beta-glucosidase|nr:glycoside hydrolase family 3 C-terminal domain-containing protein [Treponema sp.]
MREFDEALKKLTIDEKAALCAGINFWMTKGLKNIGLPSFYTSDGPNGLRCQNAEEGDHLSLNESHKAVCYPAAAAVACSWDRELLEYMGDNLGKDAAQRNVDILLGPGLNIKRSPLCGRNFEYFSEDPYLAGQLASAYIQGVQKNKVSACPKHFAMNNQETRRQSVNVKIDERTMREIYLAGFETCIKEGKAWSIMSSYNKVNGSYLAEHHHLLAEILRKEWGFNGLVISDWGSIDKIVDAVREGVSVQMPGVDESFGEKAAKAVHEGRLNESCLDRIAAEFWDLMLKTKDRQPSDTTIDTFHEAAMKIACESIVLLKNEHKLLPFSSDIKLAVVGEMAKNPRFQGAGSSHVNEYLLTNAWDEIKKNCPNAVYAQGCSGETVSDNLLDEACRLASHSDAVVLFTGLPESFESEGFDRTGIDIPFDYCRLIEKLAQANKKLAVVLSNGSCIAMPWIHKVSAILETYLGGEAVGTAVAKILFGGQNPCGKLAETFPKRVEHNPSYFNFPGEKDTVEYREGIFVGYRYYQKKKIEPLFEFGYGLSYTTFEYSCLMFDRTEITDTGCLTVRCRIKNTGNVFGKEIVQLYIENPVLEIIRPVRELRDFKKISLDPGEEKEIIFKLEKRAFAYYNEALSDWHVETGEYGVCIGASSDDIRLQKTVKFISSVKIMTKVTRNTLFRDIYTDPVLLSRFEKDYNSIKPYLPFGLAAIDSEKDPTARGILYNMTLNSLASYVGRHLDDVKLEKIINNLNGIQAETIGLP